MPEIEVIVNIVLSSIISFLGTVGNIIVISAFCSVTSLRTITNMFVLQLAIIDLIKASVILPTKVVNQAKSVTSMNPIYCQIIGVLRTMGSCQPAILLAMIAIVRYFKVVKPHSFSRIFTFKKSIIYISCTSTATILIGLLPVMGLGKYAFSGSHGVCFVSWSKENIPFRTIYYICNVGFAFPVLVFCYFRIFRTVRFHSATVTPQLSNAMSSRFTENPGHSSSSSSTGNVTREPMGGAATSNECNMFESEKKRSSGLMSENLEIELKRDIFVVPLKHAQQMKYRRQETLDRMNKKQNKNRFKLRRQRGQKRKSRQVELEVTLVMFAIVVVYTLCWIPALIVTVLSLSNAVKFSRNFLIFIVTMVDAKVALNPLIYGVGSKQFRNAFKVVLHRMCRS